MNDKQNTVRSILGQRKLAYQQTFEKEDQAVKAVLKDLAKFCRANATTFHTDARLHAVLEGRREVWLRIQQHLQLTTEDLLKILGG